MNDISMLYFLPVTVLINMLIPLKARYIWLFITSMFFYAALDIKSLPVLAATLLLSYGAAFAIEKNSDKVLIKKIIIFLSVIISVCAIALSDLKLIAAVGISFYMLKTLGYLIDIYRGNQEREKNFVKHALFVSFFTQIISGPIDRAGNLMKQFDEPKEVSFDRLKDGLLQMLWGYFLKMVIADRLAIYVNSVFQNPENAMGLPALFATFFYSFEIYADFAGYTHIAIGVSRILGIDIMENFKSPYLSKSIAEFWRRWHISLSSWLRDYVYIPLGGNRKGVARKYLNILIVFAVSGLWHGAGITFIVWGLLHGLYQVIGYMLKRFRVKRESFSHRALKTFVTFLLVNYAWVLFRADTVLDALLVMKNSLNFTPWKLFDGSLLSYGLDLPDFLIALAGIVFIIFADVLNYKGIVIREKILSQHIVVRYVVGIAGILVILIFGIWGPGYEASSFIYQQF